MRGLFVERGRLRAKDWRRSANGATLPGQVSPKSISAVRKQRIRAILVSAWRRPRAAGSTRCSSGCRANICARAISIPHSSRARKSTRIPHLRLRRCSCRRRYGLAREIERRFGHLGLRRAQAGCDGCFVTTNRESSGSQRDEHFRGCYPTKQSRPPPKVGGEFHPLVTCQITSPGRKQEAVARPESGWWPASNVRWNRE